MNEASKGRSVTPGTVAGLAATLSHPQRCALSKPKSTGYRLMTHPVTGLTGIGVCFLWACMSQSVGMWVVFVIGLCGIASQLNAKGVHSFSIGCPRWGATVEVCILFLAGLVCLYLDPPAGGYLLLISLCDAITHWWVWKKQEAQDMDIQDAQMEATARASRMRNTGI